MATTVARCLAETILVFVFLVLLTQPGSGQTEPSLPRSAQCPPARAEIVRVAPKQAARDTPTSSESSTHTVSGSEAFFRVRLADTIAGTILRRALAGAARRLSDPRCQAVLTDFRDRQGCPLADTIARLNVGAPEYLSWILFRDAPESLCAGTGRLAVAVPGTRAVYVCGRSFETTWRLDSGRAEATLIHEMLHTLGLGENPPTSAEITAQVLRSCGES